MRIRRATPADAPDIAAIHVAGWLETYTGILPAAYLASVRVDARTDMWRRTLEEGAAVLLAPGAGFASVGAQRDPALAEEWPEELHALYVLAAQQGRGLGRALLRAALGAERRRFSAFVLDGNDRALGFYLAIGAVELFRRPDSVDGHPVTDIALGWPDPWRV